MAFSGVLSEIHDGCWRFMTMHLEIPLARISKGHDCMKELKKIVMNDNIDAAPHLVFSPFACTIYVIPFVC